MVQIMLEVGIVRIMLEVGISIDGSTLRYEFEINLFEKAQSIALCSKPKCCKSFDSINYLMFSINFFTKMLEVGI